MKKIENLFYNEKWFTQFHKKWFWGNNGDYVLVWEDGDISLLPQGTNLHPDQWEKVIFSLPCLGWNNMTSSVYVEGVGIYNEEDSTWEWDPEYAKNYPEVVQKYGPSPIWEDIINASIETGDWTELREEILKEVNK